jgi:hypothetical protein
MSANNGDAGWDGTPPPVAGRAVTRCELGDDARPTTTGWLPAAEARGLALTLSAVPPNPVTGRLCPGTGLDPLAPAPAADFPFVPLVPVPLPLAAPPLVRVPPLVPPVTRVPPICFLHLG